MTKSSILNFAKTVTLAMIIAVGVSYTFAAWTTPPSSPPNNNTAAPINTSANSQYKVGALGVGGLFKAYLGIDANDKIIANVATPIDGKDAVNKDYVDAQGGGGGSIECVSSDHGYTDRLGGIVCVNTSNGRYCRSGIQGGGDTPVSEVWHCNTPNGWSL